MFRPEYCEDAYLFVSGVPLAVEDPYGTTESACPACGGNVLVSERTIPTPGSGRQC